MTETKTTLAGRTFVEAYGEGFLTAFLLAFLGRLLGSGSWRNRSFLLHFTGHELDRARRGEESRTRTIPLFFATLGRWELLLEEHEQMRRTIILLLALDMGVARQASS